jgi:putative SOS response-associated peptidase YedK
MCGRLFLLFNGREELIAAVNKDLNTKLNCDKFQYSAIPPPKYNISPTSYLPVLAQFDVIESLHWGFKIHGLSQIVINARNEDVETKKSFKDLIDHERCAVICSGYYEWTTGRNNKKSPYSFRPKNKELCYLAALRNKETNSFVLMTREAVPTISHIHTRMPVLLRKDDIPKWLDSKETPFIDLKESIIINETYTGKRKGSSDFIEIEFTALANYVNSVKVTGPECLLSLKEYKEKTFSNGIGKFFRKADNPDK